MKKLICTALVALMIMSTFGCSGKKSEFEPVEGFEDASEIIYGIEFGMTYDEYVKSSAHKLMAPLARDMQYTTQEIQETYPDNYADYLYWSVNLDSWRSEASFANVEFVDDSLAAINFCLNAVGGEESVVLGKQNDLISTFSAIAEEMGFVRQKGFSAFRYPATIYDGYYFLEMASHKMLSPFRAFIAPYKYEPSNPNEAEYLESDWYVKMNNEVIYYLSEDGTKVIAISPHDVYSARESLYIPGDEDNWGDGIDRLKGFDPETEMEKIIGFTRDTKFAPVYVTYYDIATAKDNYRMFDGGSGFLGNPCTVELLKEIDETGLDAFVEKYKDLFD